MEDRIKALEDRVEKLSELYGDVLHTYNLLSVLIPRLTEIIIKFLEESTDHYFKTTADTSKLRDILLGTLDDLQAHYKSHSIDKKRKKEYIPKRESFDKEDSL